MKLHKLKSIILFLSFVHSAHAQAPNPLVAANALADADLKTAKEGIEKSANSGAGYSPCAVSFLQLKESYAKWFKTEYANWFAIQQKKADDQKVKFEGVVNEVRAKMAKVKEEKIAAVAVTGQTADSVSITFDIIVDYLNNLNQRISTCSKSEMDVLMRQQNDPRFNRLHVAHSQIEASIVRMTDNLNASIKESGNKYSVSLQKTACGFDLILAGEVHLPIDGVDQVRGIHMSLLKREDLTPSLNQPEGEIQVPARIGKYSSNAFVRYVEMYKEFVDPVCGSTAWNFVLPSDFYERDAPYVTYEIADREVLKTARFIRDRGKVGSDRPDGSCPFVEADYLAYNVDVLQAALVGSIASGKTHYDAAGLSEGRAFNRLCGPRPSAAYCPFVASEYLPFNPDVAGAGLSAQSHFTSAGYRENRTLSNQCAISRKWAKE